jgi:hypothetical protein
VLRFVGNVDVGREARRCRRIGRRRLLQTLPWRKKMSGIAAAAIADRRRGGVWSARQGDKYHPGNDTRAEVAMARSSPI